MLAAGEEDSDARRPRQGIHQHEEAEAAVHSIVSRWMVLVDVVVMSEGVEECNHAKVVEQVVVHYFE